VPHKTIAFDIISEIDPAAQQIGAVNTLKRLAAGYTGYNTDGYGMENGIKEELNQSLSESDVYLLGAGGAGRAAAVQCLYSHCSRLTIFNRNQARLQTLLSDLAPLSKAQDIEVIGRSTEKTDFTFPENALVINSASLGLKTEDPLILPASSFSTPIKLFDMIYNPPRTRLMETVEAVGGGAANGLSMLVHQGAKALEIWSDSEVPSDTMQQAAIAALNNS
ncbi:MAG: shikimate dehydrogenase, partial [Verrucomicrobiota bacterium]